MAEQQEIAVEQGQAEAGTDDTKFHWSVRLLSFLTGLMAICVLAWVVIRNEPFNDPVSLQIVRAFISIAVGFGALPLPGYLGWTLKEGNRTISAAGAMGFGALTYVLSPLVAPTLDTSTIPRKPPATITSRSWEAGEYQSALEAAAELGVETDTRRVAWIERLLRLLRERDPPVRKPCFVIESGRFEHPYAGFTAMLRTVPTHDRLLPHGVMAFLIHGEDVDKSFTPLVSFNHYQRSQANSILQVPPTAAGDYLLIILELNVSQDDKHRFPTGKTFPFRLHTL